MIKKTITYSDLDGNPVTEDFWFNLTEAEVTKMELSQAGNSLSEYLKKIVEANNGAEIISIFEEILSKAYGLRNEDNKAFDKSPEISRHFMATDAYNLLFMELVTDADASSEFINGVVPRSIKDNPEKPMLPAALVPEVPLPVEPVRPPTQDHQPKRLRPVENSSENSLSREQLEARLAVLKAAENNE